MDEQRISDIAEVIPEVAMAQTSGYRYGVFSSLLWGVAFTASAFIMGYFSGLADKINILCK